METSTAPAPVYGEHDFNLQGGELHSFWYRIPYGDGFNYRSTDVAQFEGIRKSLIDYHNNVAEFEKQLRTAVSEGYLDSEIASELASTFGVSLTRELQYTVNVTYTFLATVPVDYDPYDLLDEVNFTAETRYSSDIEINDVDADETNVSWEDVS